MAHRTQPYRTGRGNARSNAYSIHHHNQPQLHCDLHGAGNHDTAECVLVQIRDKADDDVANLRVHLKQYVSNEFLPRDNTATGLLTNLANVELRLVTAETALNDARLDFGRMQALIDTLTTTLTALGNRVDAMQLPGQQ